MADQQPLYMTVGLVVHRMITGVDTIHPRYLGLLSPVVGTTDIQTLTQKTLTSPVINAIYASGEIALAFQAGGGAYFTILGQAASDVAGGPRLVATSSGAYADVVLVTKGANSKIRARYNNGNAVEMADLKSVQTFDTGKKTFAANILEVAVGGWQFATHHHTNENDAGQLDARTAFVAGASVATLYSNDVANGPTVAGNVAGVQQIANAIPFIVANSMAVLSSYRVSITGKYTTAGAARTATFIVSRDGTNHYFSTGAITLGGTVTNNRYRFEFIITCTATGAAGVATMRGILQNGYVQGATLPAPAPVIMVAPVALALGVDTTADNDIRMLVTIAGGGAGDTVTNESFYVEKLN